VELELELDLIGDIVRSWLVEESGSVAKLKVWAKDALIPKMEGSPLYYVHKYFGHS
jgi:hypothetical protein